MKDDILSLLLQAENEYQRAMKAAVEDAEKYADDRRQEQTAYVGELKRDLSHFEKTESEKLEQELTAQSAEMEKEAVRLKEQMRTIQQEKADQISERLREEVLFLIWQSLKWKR